jgi:hypothetical protein
VRTLEGLVVLVRRTLEELDPEEQVRNLAAVQEVVDRQEAQN